MGLAQEATAGRDIKLLQIGWRKRREKGTREQREGGRESD